MKRLILETGIGTDLYGEDATKAAIRAVNDAIRHSSLTLFTELELDHSLMEVRVTVGVPDPMALDLDRIAAELPRGRAVVEGVPGGQRIAPPKNGVQAGASLVATAAVEAFYPLDAGGWRRTDGG
ncbi:MAG: Lin0512 family protein [Pseudomonadota bacterium]